MATIQLELDRETPEGEITQAAGGAIGADIRIVVEDNLTRLEVETAFEKAINYLQKNGVLK